MSFVLSESEWSGSWLKVYHLSDALFKSPSRSFSIYQITHVLRNSRLRCCPSVVFSRENGIRKANILNFSSCSSFYVLKCPWGRNKLCPMLKLSFPSMNRWISHPVLMTCERACVIEWPWVVKDHHEDAVYIIKSHMHSFFHLVISFPLYSFDPWWYLLMSQ